jgi:branched-chain amino acid transport system permease protein
VNKVTPAGRLTRCLLLLLVALAVVGAAGPAAAQDDEEAPAGDEDATEFVRGTLIDRKGTRDRDDDAPVEGAEVLIEAVVLDAAGEIVEREEVGTATTDDEGRFEFGLPGPGTYAGTLDVDTLPDGVGLADDADELTFPINSGDSRTLIFDLGARQRQTTTQFDRGVDLAVTGAQFGLTIAICAVGLSLIFGTTGLTNFAHGELVTFGAIAAYYINVDGGIHIVPATFLAIIVGGIAAGLLDLGLWKPLRRRGMSLLAMMVVSIGLSIAVRNFFQYNFGETRQPYAQYAVQSSISIGPVDITPKSLWIIGICIVAMVVVAVLLQRTRMGKAMRAVADNPDLAASSGIDVDRVILYVWALGGGLATLGGVLLGIQQRVGFNSGFGLLLLMFAGITLGGLGTAYGALLGCFLVGLLVDLSTLVVSPELKNVGALLVLIIVLLVRPQGILGRAERIG